MDFSLLSQILNKDTVISKATIKQVGFSQNQSNLEVIATLIPENRDVTATVCFPFNSSGGLINLAPKVNDLVLILYSISTKEYFLVAYIPNQDEIYDKNIETGSLTLQADKFQIGKDALEAYVLGDVLKTYLEHIYTTVDSILKLLQTGTFLLTTSPGNATAPNPGNAAAITALIAQNDSDKSTYLETDSTNILSQLIFGKRVK